jgi:NADH-ubiquinone oxidoreductase chain 1
VVIPNHANKILFYLAPISTLIFSLLGWGVIPFAPGLVLFDFSLGLLYTIALSSLGIYGVLFAGWSGNSKYAFLGSLRSSAAMISYELILSTAIIIVVLLAGTFNLTAIIESQEAIWYIIPLLPVFILFFISILAETSRTPFDLQEAKITNEFGLEKECYMLETPKARSTTSKNLRDIQWTISRKPNIYLYIE